MSDIKDPATKQLALSAEELLHELHVHQVELEMQNGELRRAYEALETSRDRYVDLYEFAPICYLTLSKDAVITEINLTGCKIFGMDRKQLIQRRFVGFVIDAEKEHWYRLFYHVMKSDQEDKHSFDLKMQCLDNSLIHVHIDCQRRTEPDTSTILHIALTDITESKIIAEKLRLANLRKDEFLAMLAHELRNPLTPIRNMVQLLNKQKGNDPLVERACQVVDRQVTHMARLLDDLLDLARIMHGKINLKLELLALTDIIAHAVETSNPLIVSKEQVLTISHAQTPQWIKGDSVRLSQVISNLLDNASKYTQMGGKISLSVLSEETTVTIKIQDNGTGISPDIIHDIFELFVQGDRSLAHSQGGLGIGLTLVSQLVEKHGGTVTAKSRGVGLGSLFSVRLPVISMNSSTIETQKIQVSSKYRILLVDDYADAAESLMMVLEAEGHKVDVANCGMKAIELAKANPPNVVLLDIGLPDLNGYEVAKTLRTLSGTQDSTLIAVTGYGQPSDIEQSKIAGFDHYLLKPIDFNTLLAILENLDK
ncbi:MAG: ATP-binding protein [Methylococcales bacterium]